MMTVMEAAQILGSLPAPGQNNTSGVQEGGRCHIGARPLQEETSQCLRRWSEEKSARIGAGDLRWLQHSILHPDKSGLLVEWEGIAIPQLYRGALDLNSNIARRVGEAMVKSSKGSYDKY